MAHVGHWALAELITPIDIIAAIIEVLNPIIVVLRTVVVFVRSIRAG